MRNRVLFLYLVIGILVLVDNGQLHLFWEAVTGSQTLNPNSSSSSDNSNPSNKGGITSPITFPSKPVGSLGNPAGSPGGVQLYAP